MNRQQQIDRFLLDAHRLAMQRLRADPHRIGAVRNCLERWRSQAGASRSDPYWNEWERLLKGDLDALERAVSDTSERADALRNVSPMASLITQRERLDLLRQARMAS